MKADEVTGKSLAAAGRSQYEQALQLFVRNSGSTAAPNSGGPGASAASPSQLQAAALTLSHVLNAKPVPSEVAQTVASAASTVSPPSAAAASLKPAASSEPEPASIDSWLASTARRTQRARAKRMANTAPDKTDDIQVSRFFAAYLMYQIVSDSSPWHRV
jgi:hypothetical protein